MAFETELSNIAKRTDEISDGISAALVQSVVAVPLIYKEDLPTGTNVKLFRKDGSLTADALAESTAWTYGAGSELTQSTVSATAAKTAVASKITVEALQFSEMDLQKLMVAQGSAIGRDLDDDVLALTAGLANSVTATSILTVNDVIEGAFTVRAGLAGGMRGLVGLFDYKGIKEIVKEIMSSGATPFGQPAFTTLLGDAPAANGFYGNLPGVAIYGTDGLPTTGGDDQAAVFNPDMCFAGMYSPSVNTQVDWIGGSGFYWEVASWVFSKVVEWNDAAGCMVRSDT